MPKAMITGIAGQDGRYLAKYLHALGYEVSGLVHGDAEANEALIRNTLPFVDLVPGDLKDLTSLIDAVEEVRPDEVYNFGAVSSVALSFQQPELTADVTGLGVLRLLEAIRAVGGDRSSIRLYQASSSEMFGQVDISPQNEQTPFHPRSPYGAAKVFGHHVVVNYREAYGLYAVSGICFNHESPLRPIEFVTRKVTRGVAKVIVGLQDEIVLGNLDAQRDWGFAGDYVRAMWLMLQQPGPDDYVVATGETHSVREVVETAFRAAGIDDWEPHVRSDERFLRPADIATLVGDAGKARAVLKWQPEVSFDALIAMMVHADLELVEAEARNSTR